MALQPSHFETFLLSPPTHHACNSETGKKRVCERYLHCREGSNLSKLNSWGNLNAKEAEE